MRPHTSRPPSPWQPQPGPPRWWSLNQGQPSNAIPITIGVPQPQLGGVGVSILSSTAPPQFQPYYPIVHNNSQANVTPTAPAALNEVLQVLVGGLGPDLAPTATPAIAIGGQNAAILQIDVDASNGRETLYFQVPQNAPLGIDQVVASVSGVWSNSVGIPVGSGPEVGSVLNGASFSSLNVVAPVAQVLFSGVGPGYNGLYQVDVQIPSNVSPGSDVPLVITVGQASDSSTTVAIQ